MTLGGLHMGGGVLVWQTLAHPSSTAGVFYVQESGFMGRTDLLGKSCGGIFRSANRPTREARLIPRPFNAEDEPSLGWTRLVVPSPPDYPPAVTPWHSLSAS